MNNYNGEDSEHFEILYTIN
ncbi:unnamed protein product, partial [Fusarium fujikuroi]